VSRRLARWWRLRKLRTRLAVLTAGAVAVAVLTVSGLAWAVVGRSLDSQLESQLRADAQAIAADPGQWTGPGPGHGGHGGFDRGDRATRTDLGTRWQILAADGTVTGSSPDPLPVTDAARSVAAGSRAQAQEHVTIGTDTYLLLTVPTRAGGAAEVAVDEGPVDRTRTTLWVLLAVASALGIGGSATLGRAVARAGLGPVQRLTAAVEEAAVTMDLTRPVPQAEGDDEVGRLARAVNTLLAAIDRSRRAQRTLVEDAGHELRTPLTSIRTNIELLLEVERRPELAHRLPPEDRLQLLHDLDSQVLELATLTGELVELAREEATRELVERVDLAEVVGTAIGRVRVRAPRVSFAADLSPVSVDGRPGELERMVVNILDNAAKWSAPDGTVAVELREEAPGWCLLRVTDNGPGIDEADRPYVFDRFYRAPAARGMPGSGLGLAIVAQTAAQHGGAVAVEPHTPTGTALLVRLPTSAVAPVARNLPVLHSAS
jgi:two-component system sensor histidine kinase MprB